MRTPAVASPGADVTPRSDIARRLDALPRSAVLTVLAAGVFLAMLLVPVVVSGALGIALDGRVMPRVAIAGVDVGLLTAAEAEARLRERLPDITAGNLVITLDGETTRVPLTEVGRDHDYAGLVASALAVGRSGDPWADGQARLAALVLGNQIPDAVAIEPERLDQLVVNTAARTFTPPIDAAVITNPDGTYAVTVPVAGRRVHPDTIRGAVLSAVLEPGTDEPAIALTSEPIPFAVTQSEAAAAAGAARAMFATPLRLVDGGDAYVVEAEAIHAAITFGSRLDDSYGVLLDRAVLAEALSTHVTAIHRDPQDATFTFNGATPNGVQAAVTGRDLNVPATVAAVVDGLELRGAGVETPEVALAATFVEPSLTTAAATEILPQLVRLSTWTTRYVPSSGNGFSANISIPAMDIDRMVILPGEDFDFWRDIGPVTAERGFTYGGAIIDGRSTGDQAIGGGICSTSTTIFNTALRAGLQMGARANHYYYIDRYPMGLDATVFATSSYEQSMTFTNDTAGPVVIRSFASPGLVRFDLWGLPTNRVVTFSAPTTWGHRSAADTIQYTSTLPAGTSKRVEFPHHGFSVTVTRTVRDATTGEVIHSNTYNSYYQTVNGVTLVGTG
jgi:vancomycin resistance protein YoaR